MIRAGVLARVQPSDGVFGEFTPAVSTYLIQVTHDKAAPGYWLSFAAVCAFAVTVRLQRGRARDTASTAPLA